MTTLKKSSQDSKWLSSQVIITDAQGKNVRHPLHHVIFILLVAAKVHLTLFGIQCLQRLVKPPYTMQKNYVCICKDIQRCFFTPLKLCK